MAVVVNIVFFNIFSRISKAIANEAVFFDLIFSLGGQLCFRHRLSMYYVQ